MFTTTAIAGLLAGFLSIIAYFFYILTILRGKTRPNRATWWIWTLVGFFLASSYFASGARYTMWVPVTYVIGPLVTAVLSLKYGEGGWTSFDQKCLGGVGVSVVLWLFTGSPTVALAATLLIDALGCIPTIRKAYHHPQGESRAAWGLWLVGNIINIFAIESWSFRVAGYPVYMLTGTGVIASLVFFRPRSSRSLK